MNGKWPDCFPVGCPPGDAEPKEMLVYRYCTNNPLTSEDFQTYFQMYPQRRYYATEANAHGLSVLTDETECIKGLKYPAQKKKIFKGYASGRTYEYTGVVKQTGNNPFHITWWIYEGIKPEEFFSICG